MTTEDQQMREIEAKYRAEVRAFHDAERRFKAAVAALQGMLADGQDMSYEEMAAVSVKFADALLAELRRQPATFTDGIEKSYVAHQPRQEAAGCRDGEGTP